CASLALFSRGRILLYFLSRNASRRAAHCDPENVGAKRPVETEDEFRSGLSAMSQNNDGENHRAHAPCFGFTRKSLLQLPYATHHIRAAACDAQSSGFVAERERKRRLRSAQRL